jgi:pyruvate/2-oxoglutarate dehydrogenase complex dihydrolipoamide acyltransferase (E2) component
MALIEMVMPKMGESIMEGTILNWLKKEGDRIEQDESVLEVATDKVDTEVPATHAGVLQKILVESGQVVEVGKPIAVIATGADAQNPPPADAPSTPEVSQNNDHAAVLENAISTIRQDHGVHRLPEPAQGRFYSPLVLTIAREEKISMQELEYIPGTGGDNRVTKKDILNYVASRSSGNGSSQSDAPAVEISNRRWQKSRPNPSLSAKASPSRQWPCRNRKPSLGFRCRKITGAYPPSRKNPGNPVSRPTLHPFRRSPFQRRQSLTMAARKLWKWTGCGRLLPSAWLTPSGFRRTLLHSWKPT